MSAKNSEVILNSSATHRATSFIKTTGGEDIVSYFPRHQVSTHDTLDTHSVISTQAVPTNVFQNGGGYVEFALPRLSKKIDEITLELQITNTNGTEVEAKAIMAACLLVDHIEYFAGTSFLMSMDFLAYRFREAMTKTDESLGATAEFSNTRIDSSSKQLGTYDSTISSGETKTFYLPVTNCFKTLIPAFLNEDLRMRVHFAKERAFTAANDSGLVLGNARLLIEACNMHSNDLADVKAVYESGSMSVRYYEPRTQKIPLTIATSSNYQISLQNLYGNFVSLWVCSQVNDPSILNSLDTLRDFESLWLTNSSNEVMFGGTTTSASWLLYSASRFYPSSFLGAEFLYSFNASMNPSMDLLTGTHHGSFQLHAKGEALNFTTKGTLVTNATRQIVLIGWHASLLRIQNGSVVVLR